jgi:hypothetical protein
MGYTLLHCYFLDLVDFGLALLHCLLAGSMELHYLYCPHKQREQYISVIEKAEDRNKKRWMPILQRYLEDVIAVPHMHINKVS